MSTTIAAMVINLLATVLPWLGVSIGTEQLTTTVTTLIAIGSALYVWIKRTQSGDVKWYGARK